MTSLFFGVVMVLGLSTWCTSADFASWAQEHSKSYASEVHLAAAKVEYMKNEAIIAMLNAEPTDTAFYGHTRFSDLSPEDFRSTYLGVRPGAIEEHGEGRAEMFTGLPAAAPSSFDWRAKNAVTPVKNQQSCGSCWAESAVQNIESVHYLATSPNSTSGPVALSTEQIIECDPFDYACYGGFPSGAFKYVISAGGIATAQSYPDGVEGKTICLANQTFNATCGDGMCDDPPLTSWCDLTCSAKSHQLTAKISAWHALPSNETALAAFLANNNPISVALDAGGPLGALLPWLQFYKRGVANPKRCATHSPDHAVLLVGYGTDGIDYWSVKNSWGVKWGEEGYFRIARGTSKCGINTLASTSVA